MAAATPGGKGERRGPASPLSIRPSRIPLSAQAHPFSMIATRGVLSSQAGGCEQRAILTASDPIVALAPEAFRPLAHHLGLRSS